MHSARLQSVASPTRVRAESGRYSCMAGGSVPVSQPLGQQMVHQQNLSSALVFNRPRTQGKEAWRITASLRSSPHRTDFSSSFHKFESQDPFTRNIPIINFRGAKFPTSRGLQGQLGEIFARSGRIQLRSHYTACRINADRYAHPHLASNSASRLPGHVGQDLMNDLSRNRTNGGCC